MIKQYEVMDARERLLAGIPVSERRLRLAGIPTVVLEGGDGPPVVLLHGPGGSAVHWAWVIPELVKTHRVVAPDLPGQGASPVVDGPLDAGRVLAWLGELIGRTCPSPPTLVGHAVGGGIAVRFAGIGGERISRLVLVDALGLTQFEPAPGFGLALNAFLAEPTELTHDHLWQQCALDLDRLRRRMGERWQPFRAYNVDRARTQSVKAALGVLMGEFGVTAVPPTELARIAVPTALIWGRHDLATRLEIAEAASARYGWPLHVIEGAGDDPPLDQPDAFLDALRAAIGTPIGEVAAS